MNPEPDMVWTTVKLAGALVAMVAVLLLLQRVVIRTRLNGFTGSPIRIIHTLRIGVRSHIVFLHIPDAVLVLGITPSSITNLMTITDAGHIDQFIQKPLNKGIFQRFLSDHLNVPSRISREHVNRGSNHAG
ncbi:MAG: flagellar biosynthetic protein FliO [Thermodesulfobacteriota bacterium]